MSDKNFNQDIQDSQVKQLTPRERRFQYETKLLKKSSNIIGSGIIASTILMYFFATIGFIVLSLLGDYDYLNTENSFNGYDPVSYYLLEIIVSVLSMGIPLIFMFRSAKQLNPSSLLPFKKADFKLGMALFIFGLLACSAANITVSGMAEIFHINPPPTPYEGSPLVITLMIIRVSIIPAIFEELIFRGVVLSSLRRYGDMFAILVSSVLFSILHGNLVQIPFALACGLAFGFIAVKTNSLLIPILIHFTNNFKSCISTIISEEISLTAAGVVMLVSSAIVLILGIISIKHLVKNYKHIFEFNDNPTLLSFKQRLKTLLSSPAIIIFLVLTIILTVMNTKILQQ